MITYLLVFSIAIGLSLALTYLVREWATRRGWVDHPDSERKLHKTPIPRLGGLAIYLSMVWSLTALYFLPSPIGAQLRSNLAEAAVLVALGGLMLFIGIWDDLKGLSPWTKLLAQLVIATASWAAGFRILGVWNGNGTIFLTGIFSLPITLIWIVAVTNAFNLIDGIDGLSSGAALMAMLPLAVASILGDQPLSVVILAALAGATLGFLRYNFNPATIFLGDSGSLTLGFMLALVAVKYSQKSATAVAIAVPVVAFGLPMLDMAIVIMRRFLSGKPVFLGDRRHIHHVLLGLGLNPQRVLITLYGVCGLFGLFSLLFMNPSGKVSGAALAILGACIWFAIQRLRYPELREFMGYVMRGIQDRRKLMAGNFNVGTMLEGFRSAENLSHILECLSGLLKETEFSGVEVRLPRLRESLPVFRVRDWIVTRHGRDHYLYRWADASLIKAANAEGNPRIQISDLIDRENTFRLEHVFELPSGPHLRETGSDALLARITFYHPIGNESSVSAVCLLSRNVWREFAAAVCRVTQQAGAGRKTDSSQEASASISYPAISA
jgi:UDP-GlcNAc:undecaprenyl-phosphate/decaprenyl-phosphate GlcNAc-1-phosphate transferase